MSDDIPAVPRVWWSPWLRALLRGYSDRQDNVIHLTSGGVVRTGPLPADAVELSPVGAADGSAGRCGATSLAYGRGLARRPLCSLAAGHAGWHKDGERGTEWGKHWVDEEAGTPAVAPWCSCVIPGSGVDVGELDPGCPVHGAPAVEPVHEATCPSCGATIRARMADARPDFTGQQDDCLLAITDGNPLPTKDLRTLPPWRAVMLARVAAKAGVGLERGTLDQLVAEASAVGGRGVLGDWWKRAAAAAPGASGLADAPEPDSGPPCPECGNDPDDPESHRADCPRCDTDDRYQCGPPWNPLPDHLKHRAAAAGPSGPVEDTTQETDRG
ncbi:MAG: hypothetical protein ACRDXE_09040 [Acidimicrobiales bacterium]